MSIQTRRKKRELRKLNRKERKVAFNKLVDAVKAVKDVELDDQLSYKDKFKQIWPVLKPIIEFTIILKVTGDKFDSTAKHIIVLGDNMFGSEITEEEAIEFLNKLQSIWNMIEMVFEIIKIVTNDKTDAIIDKVIEIGEWLFE